MTQEVGRLHRERQIVQNQIADLFAFYTKQKQAGEVVSVRLESRMNLFIKQYFCRLPPSRLSLSM